MKIHCNCNISLRAAYIVVTLICIALGMVSYSSHQQKSVERTIRIHGGYVLYDFKGPIAKAIRDYIPAYICGRLNTVSVDRGALTTQDVKNIASLPHLQHLSLRFGAISDQHLNAITISPTVETLILSHNVISDRSLRDHPNMPNLEILYIDHTLVGDDGIQWLSQSKKVRIVDVSGTKVSARGVLALLRNMPVLERLNICDTCLSEEDLGRLRMAMPNVLIEP